MSWHILCVNCFLLWEAEQKRKCFVCHLFSVILRLLHISTIWPVHVCARRDHSFPMLIWLCFKKKSPQPSFNKEVSWNKLHNSRFYAHLLWPLNSCLHIFISKAIFFHGNVFHLAKLTTANMINHFSLEVIYYEWLM